MGLSQASAGLLEDFVRFWELATDPAERGKPLRSLIAEVWAGTATSSPANRTGVRALLLGRARRRGANAHKPTRMAG
jgi:hypothetical protein